MCVQCNTIKNEIYFCELQYLTVQIHLLDAALLLASDLHFLVWYSYSFPIAVHSCFFSLSSIDLNSVLVSAVFHPTIQRQEHLPQSRHDYHIDFEISGQLGFYKSHSVVRLLVMPSRTVQPLVKVLECIKSRTTCTLEFIFRQWHHSYCAQCRFTIYPREWTIQKYSWSIVVVTVS